MGLGAALLIAAILLATYTVGQITKIPLDIESTLISDGTGTGLDPESLLKPNWVVNKDVPLVMQQQFSTESPANADVVTLQVGTTLRRTDKQQENGLLLAMVDTVTMDRKTAMAVSTETNPGGAVQKPRTIEDSKPPTNVVLPHDGLTYRFPFDVEKKTYQVFDPIAQKAYDANYDGEEDVLGLTTFHFRQNIGFDAAGKLVEPVKYPSLYDKDEDSTVTARAAEWGVESAAPEDEITMTRYYAAQREFWVDPVSGTIVKSQEHGLHYFARDAMKPELTFVDFTVTSTEATVESQVNTARNERDRIALWGRVLPISFSALGIIALIGGAALGAFSLRAENMLTEPGFDGGDEGFGRAGDERVPGAEAVTEKLPTQRPLPPGGPPG